MSNGISLLMYGTSACSLCDQAFDVLMSMPELAGLTLRVVDVAADAALTERYGERLPVLALGSAELDWVFTADQVRRLLRSASERT